MSDVLSRTDVVRLAAIVEASRTESEVGLVIDGNPLVGTARQIVGDGPDIRDQELRITFNQGLAFEYQASIRQLVSGFGDSFAILGGN